MKIPILLLKENISSVHDDNMMGGGLITSTSYSNIGR